LRRAPRDAWTANENDARQKKLANPVSDLVALPMQFTTTLHTGPNELPQHTLNIQPVYPTQLRGGWSLIHRLILPVLSDPAVAPAKTARTAWATSSTKASSRQRPQAA